MPNLEPSQSSLYRRLEELFGKESADLIMKRLILDDLKVLESQMALRFQFNDVTEQIDSIIGKVDWITRSLRFLTLWVVGAGSFCIWLEVVILLRLS